MTCWLGNMKSLRLAIAIALLSVCSQAANAVADTPPLLSYNRTAQSAAPRPTPQQNRVDAKHVAAGVQLPAPPIASPPAPNLSNNRPTQPIPNQRLLAQPTRQQIAAPRAPSFGMPKIESFATAGAGLAIVVGLFLVCMWLLRRSGPKPTTPLPSEAVAVLGRVPLAARNFAHLLRIGNKLVLVAITPDGVAPITEVTDPIEVQQLLGLCQRNQKQSTTAEFHDVLQQLAKEPASGLLGSEATASYARHTR